MPRPQVHTTQAMAEAIRLQLGSDALILISPGPDSCDVVVTCALGCPTRLTYGRTEPASEQSKTREDDRIAYSVAEAAGLLGLSREMIYDQLRAKRLRSVKVGRRRIITRQHIDAWLASLDR